jgi:hypothetical protein
LLIDEIESLFGNGLGGVKTPHPRVLGYFTAQGNGRKGLITTEGTENTEVKDCCLFDSY